MYLSTLETLKHLLKENTEYLTEICLCGVFFSSSAFLMENYFDGYCPGWCQVVAGG